MMDGLPSAAAADPFEAAGGRAALRRSGGDGIVARLARRWWAVAVMTVLGLGAGFIYLAAVQPTYVATAILLAERNRPATANDAPAGEFLAAQHALIQSPRVIDSVGSDFAAQARAGLRVRSDRGEGTITLTMECPPQSRERAKLALNQLADAYLRAFAEQSSSSAGLGELSSRRDGLAAERATREKALLAHRAETASDTGAGRAAAQQQQQLRQALADAERRAAKAAADIAAVDALKEKPEELGQVMEAARSTGVFAALDQQRAKAKEDLDALEPQHARQRQTLLAQHPALLATEAKMRQLRLRIVDIDNQYATVYRAELEKQRAAAAKTVQEVQALLGAPAQQASDPAAAAARAAELEAALKGADEALAAADRKLRDAVAGGDDQSVTMKLVQPAMVPSRPARPDRSQVLLTAGSVALLLGLALAALVPSRGTHGAATAVRDYATDSASADSARI